MQKVALLLFDEKAEIDSWLVFLITVYVYV